MAVSKSNKTSNWLGNSAMFPTHVNFFLLCIRRNLFTPWQWIPMGRMGKGRSELLTSQMRFFFRAMSTKLSMKMQNCKMRFFLLLIGQLVKGGTIRGTCSSPHILLSEVAIEGLSISFELTGIWNVINRFPEPSHYLLFACNAGVFLLLQYCLRFSSVKRAWLSHTRGDVSISLWDQWSCVYRSPAQCTHHNNGS